MDDLHKDLADCLASLLDIIATANLHFAISQMENKPLPFDFIGIEDQLAKKCFSTLAKTGFYQQQNHEETKWMTKH